ncbi:MAG: RluA family pseudouridine synthase [Bacteroidales bacterium]|jgi:23S rRNA pseudouridine1911/1915/1917 synthase
MTDEEVVIPDEDEIDDEEGGSFEHYRYVSDKGQGLIRVDKYITMRMEKTSRHRIQLAIAAGYVLANGKVVKASYIVKPFDVITIVLPYERKGFEIMPEDIPLDIPYEDEDLLLVNKPPGLVVHPGHGHFSGTLINALAFHLGKSQKADAEDDRMGILVHRIDKNTSGLLLVAKNDEAQLYLAKQFFDHSIKRKYVALVWGNVKAESGTIVGNIARDPNERMKFKVFPEGNIGKHAVTHYRVLERFGYTTLVECELETGRTHQIRVHMDYIGHPLFNDDRYGGDKILKGTVFAKFKQFVENCFEIMPRHALHARTLGFVHPRTKKDLHFENEIPQDLATVIERWRNYSKNSSK